MSPNSPYETCAYRYIIVHWQVKCPKQKFILGKINLVLFKTQEKDFHISDLHCVIDTRYWSIP